MSSKTFSRATKPAARISLLRLMCGASLTAVAVSGVLSPAAAQTWNGNTSNDWTVGTNWSTGTPPTTGPVTINTETPNPAVIGVSGPVTATSGLLTMGTTAATSSLTIQNGSTLSSITTGGNVVGQTNGANATVTVTGLGSDWSIAGSVILGNGFTGTGTLNILDRATASVASLLVGQTGGGSGVLNVTGGGVLTVTGNATMFRRSGNSTANISGAGSQWNVGGTLAVGSGATGGSSGSGTLTVDNGAVVSAAGTITIGGPSLSTAGLGTITVTGAGSQLSGGGALNIGQWGTGTLTVSNSAVATAGTVTLAGGTAGNGTLNLLSGGILASQALTGGAGVLRQVNFDGGTLRATASNAAFVTGFTGTELNIAAGGLTLDSAGFDITAASPFTGVGALVKTGLGTAVLAGNNAYSGVTNVDQGALVVGNGGTTGSIASATSNVAAGAALGFNRSDALTYAGTIQGAGSLRQLGTGTTILTGTSTYTGGTTIAGGTLRLGSGGTTGSILGDVVNNGTLSFSRSDAWTFGGSITGAGSVTSIAGGITTLTGSSNYGGATTISGGGGIRILGATVTSGNSALASGGALTVDTGGVFNTTAVGAQSSAGVAGSINVQNGGVLRATGNVTVRNSPTNVVDTSLNVTGAGSRVEAGGGLLVAASSASNIASTHITAGGVLTTAGASSVGFLTGNTTTEPVIEVSGAGSAWTSTSTLAMSNGSFSVLGGGAASFASATIGSASEGADLLVSGANSSFATTGDLVLGALPGGTDLSSSGALTLSNGGRLSVGGAFTLANAAGSTGTLNIGGGGAAGVLDAATLAFGPGTGALVFNHTDTGYGFAAAVSGAGAINQVAGDTNLTANSAGFAGTTTVSGGTLRVNGTLGGATSTVNVLSGGRLGGAGTIGGNVNVTDGVLAPGNSPGTLTIAGSLSLTGASVLDFEFGQAGTAGGALNDLIDVGGDLVLDGTIDVTQSAGGSFGPGVYRILNYAGTLTNNGLLVGTMPAGSEAFVQTVVPGQVNLVNTAGLTLGFWDGAAGAKNDGAIQGGVGTWRVGGGENNWTEAFGAVNADYAQDSFAIFSGLGGTVTIDNGNGNGNVRAAGMQFAVDGYTLMGGPLELTGTQAFVRVGDGSAGDAAITATIASALTGSARLVKDMGGTLILTGANSYTGGTAINGGTLDVSSDANLGDAAGGLSFDGGTLDITTTFASSRAVNLVGTGTFRTQGTGFTLRGAVSGAGALVKDGNGTVTLTADNSYTGGTTINAGVLNLGEGDTTGSILGNIANNGRFAINRSNMYTLTGAISGSGELFQMGTGTTILTAANSYTGATRVSAGTLLINGDQSAATGLTSLAADATLGGTGTIGGDVRVGAGTLAPGAGGAGTLTINGDLSMVAGSRLAFDFGRSNAPGDPLNDLVNVGGDLTLDGTINVAVTPGGAFDIGLYRIVNYAGTLTNNGLAIGTMPAGAELSVQTSILGQVNLVNTGGATLNFWDGNTGPKFNGGVNGGSGVWWATGTDNWTDATGAVNAAYDNGAFAVFAGTSGLVTIDNSQGAVTASGLQFAASGGYRIQGDALTLTGPQSVIRVGDGTSAGLGHSVIIASEVTGNTQLVKTDLGRLELTGANTYTGGTALNGGTVRISSDANLGAASGGLSFNGGTLNTTADLTSARAVTLAGQGVFSTDAGTTLTLTGNLTGTGLIGKLGAGTLVLAGTGSQTGGIEVVQGTMLVNGNYAAATGLVTMNQITTLGGTGTIGGNVNLSGMLAPGANGVGTLTINGNLTISQSATLAWEFGAANVAGGALNDLVNVGGNLILDGTIDVSVPTGGAFDAGVYRVFNYGGTLTDNGLTLGAMPAGSNVSVQTSIAGQVNLVNSAGLTLAFWDGAAGPKNNGVINGGTGTWQNSSGNDNWADASGVVNAPYSDGAFTVFGGTGGTVTVDNGLGQVTASGMQFAADGYTIAGSGIALTDSQSTLRVGDGSTAGVGFTATINAALSGNSQLVKTDAGTLVLGGTNTYTGGTLVNGGTVQVSADANLGAASGSVTLDGGTLATGASLTSARDFVLAGAGTISTAADTTFTLGGLVSGTGNLTKAGAGTLVLGGASAGYAGTTRIAAGTLAVTGTLGGAVNVDAAGRLEGTGSVGVATNTGTIAPGLSGVGTLTLTGNYTGVNGTLEIEAELSGDGARADRLVVGGSTAGTTLVKVANLGGTGAPTVEGIRIVDVAGASNGMFTLEGDYVFEGAPAVIAGAYGYRLYKGGVSTPADGDWYLRSALLSPVIPPETPLYQPGVPVYEAYAQTLATLNAIGTMQERVGNRRWSSGSDGISGIWGRMGSARSRPNAVQSTSLSDVNVDSWEVELGADQAVSTRSDGSTLVVGVLGSYGEARANIASVFGNGSIKAKGYSAGATLSWFGPQGFYVDGRAQYTWFDSKLKSNTLGKLADGNDGTGQAYSVEVGKRSAIGGALSVTPQIQTVYSTVSFKRFADPNGATVSSRLGDSLKTRWGISIDRQDAASHLYAVGNLSYEWLDGTATDVSGTLIARENHRLWGEVGLGGSVTLGSRVMLYSELSGNTALNDFGKSYSLKGVAGLKLPF